MEAQAELSTSKKGPDRRDLTDKYLKALRPAEAGKRRIVWDIMNPFFGVRVSDRADARGKATGISFILMRRLPGEKHPTRVTLGRYPALSLARAREAAAEALELIKTGTKPAEEKKRQAREAAERRASTVGALAEEFIADMRRRKLRNAAEFEAIIRREFLGQAYKAGAWVDSRDKIWRARPLGEITTQDAARLIRDITNRGGEPEPGHGRRKSGGPWAAHHALAIGKTMWGWALDQHLYPIAASPFERLKPKRLIGEKKPRQRTLEDAELRAVWLAAERMGGVYGDLVRLLALTGQRLTPVKTMQRSEVDLGKAVWITPAGKMKKDKPYATPLAPAALDLLRRRLDEPAHRNGFVFSTTGGEKPFSGFSKAKKRLDAVVEAIRREQAGDKVDELEPVPAWTLHDLRRTLRSGLPALGVSDVVCEAVLAHARQGIAGVYDLYPYLPEKREALERWAAKIATIVDPPPPAGADEPAGGLSANIVQLGESRSGRRLARQ